MIDNNELEKFAATYSLERLSSFAYSKNDTFEDIVENYSNNITISQVLYPELCTLEVILRNSIDCILRKYISETWIEDEINNNVWLDSSEYKTLVKAYNSTKEECLAEKKVFTIGKVVAKLNFGFWTNLCVKKYNAKIWNKHKCFYGVFVHYPHKPSVNIIAKKLYTIRRFRNRIFHYEKIFKYPERTLSLYKDILEMLSYLSNDELKILKKTSTFLDAYNRLMKKEKLSNKKT